jgi:phage terminase large subunit GpA-like protein
VRFADPPAVLRDAAKFLLPNPPLWVDEWSERHAVIPSGTAAEPGRYRLSRTPYAGEVLRALSPDHPARYVVVEGASQLLKTQAALNWFASIIDQAPANIIALEPSDNLAKRLSGRIGKMLASTPKLDGKWVPPRSRSGRNTISLKEFTGGDLHIMTSGSAKNLAELQARYFFADEIDRWELNLEKEGDPIEIAENRLTSYGTQAKSYYTSSPLLVGFSKIHELFLRGNQHYFNMPCPHCGGLHAFEPENLRYDIEADRAVRAYMIHAGCGKEYDDSNKSEMMAAGKWVATAPGDGETWSYNINALYAPVGWTSWLSLANQKIRADRAITRNDQEPMQVLVNTRWARPYDPGASITTAEEMERRAHHHPLRLVVGGVVLTCAVDVQGDYLDVAVYAWGKWLEGWCVDRQIINGNPIEAATWAKLDEYLAASFYDAEGYTYKIKACLIDTGGSATHDVYNYVRNRRRVAGPHVLGIKGASRPGKPIISSRPSKMDVRYNGTVDEAGVELWFIGTDTAKQYLWERWQLIEGGGALHFGKALGIDWFSGLMSEKRKIAYRKGRRIVEWLLPNGVRNEPLDLTVYNLAAAMFLGLHKWQEPDWDRQAANRTKAEAPAPQAAPVVRSPTREKKAGYVAKGWIKGRY